MWAQNLGSRKAAAYTQTKWQKCIYIHFVCGQGNVFAPLNERKSSEQHTYWYVKLIVVAHILEI